MRTQAREQNSKAEGLGNIIISARVQAQNFVHIAVISGEHDDGCGNIRLAHKLARFSAQHIRQINVQYDEIKRRCFSLLYAGCRCRYVCGFKFFV